MLGGDPVVENFNTEVAKGNVVGHELVNVVFRNPDSDAAFEDVSFVGTTLVYPTAGEQWEVVSSNAADSAAGTGARTIIVRYLDTNYEIQDEIVTMNGTTPVSLVATDSFRPFGNGMVALTWGADNENQGNITLRVAGGGNVRTTMPAGDNRSLDSYYTIPAGKVGVVVYANVTVKKGDDSIVRAKFTIGDSPGFITGITMAVFQTSVEFTFPGDGALFPEKSDIKLTCSSSANSEVNGIYQLHIIDSELVNLES